MFKAFLMGNLVGVLIGLVTYLLFIKIIPFEKFKNEKPFSVKRFFNALIAAIYYSAMLYFIFILQNPWKPDLETDHIDVIAELFYFAASNYYFLFKPFMKTDSTSSAST